MNLFKYIFSSNYREEVRIMLEDINPAVLIESGVVKEMYTTKVGRFCRIRTAHEGEEIWRFRPVFPNNDIDVPAGAFKTLEEFIHYTLKETQL